MRGKEGKSNDDLDGRRDPGNRYCDDHVFDGRCMARVSTRLVSPRIKEGASTVRGKGQAGAGTGEEMPYQLSPGIRIYRPQFAAIRFSHRDRNSGLKSVLRAGSNGDCDSFLTHRAGATA